MSYCPIDTWANQRCIRVPKSRLNAASVHERTVGCAFTFDRCRVENPVLKATVYGDLEPNRLVACHLHDLPLSKVPVELTKRPVSALAV